MDRDVREKVIVITGGADGIGLAIATTFLEKGVKIAVLLDVNEIKGKESTTILKQKYGNDRVIFYKCDVVNDLDFVYQTIVSDYKNVHILVNNAGIGDEQNIKRVINVNTIALMEWTMKFYEHMRADKGGQGGTIINLSSILGHRISPFCPSYTASKFGIIGFSKSLGDQYNFQRSKVRVVTLCPGATKSNLTENLQAWENSILSEYVEEFKKYTRQAVEYIGIGAIEIFQKAESGSVWLVENMKPAEMWDV